MASSQGSALADASNKQLALPTESDVRDFSSKVDEVSMLVDGLSKGTISPQYVDSKLEADNLKATQKQQESAAASNDEDSPERQEELKRKVQELKARLEAKQQARARYVEYMQQNDPSSTTDYEKWDLWCPEDEDDELLASCTPNNAQLKAMEKDIDARHDRMVKERQRAERCRVAGIQAFKGKQWAEAYRCFDEGAQTERSNVNLHSNAAMASLKMGCYVQAIEHCDKVIRLYDFMLNKPEHPLVVKAWQRKAVAWTGLKHYTDAVKALESALLLAPDDLDVVQQVERAQRACNERHKIQTLQANKSDMPALLEVEAAACELAAVKVGSTNLLPQYPRSAAGLPRMQPVGKSGGVPSRVMEVCAKLQAMLKAGDDDLLVYFRSCGGLSAAAECLYNAQQLQPGLSNEQAASICNQIISSCAEVLNAACEADTNGHVLCGCAYGSVGVQSISEKLTCDDFLASCCAACGPCESICVLLHTLSTNSDSRARIARAFFVSKDAASGDRLFTGLLKALPHLSGVHQVIATSLLANCVAEKGCAKNVADSFQDESALRSLSQLVCSSSNPLLLRHAATLLGNAATQPHIRKLLALDPVSGSLTKHICFFTKSDGQSMEAMVACMTCLYNLALEKNSPMLKDALTSQQWQECLVLLLEQQNTAVIQLVVAIAARAATSYSDSVPLIAEFSSSAVSVAREAAIEAKLLQQPPKVEDKQETAREWSEPIALKVIDATMRLLAACGSAGHTQAMQDNEAVRLILWACSSPTVMDGCAGNAALCLGFLVDTRLELLRQKNAVKVLVECAYARKGTSASRNAAIAAAKLSQDSKCLEQLRECNGLEIIHSYVKI